jgi:hypothetical protein
MVFIDPEGKREHVIEREEKHHVIEEPEGKAGVQV